MSRRSYLLRRPQEDEDDYYSESQELVKAKPIDSRLARSLGDSYAGGKDFVKASQKSQQEFYGSQTILDGGSCSRSEQVETSYRQMTHDERNKLSASIIKAELKGDTERLKKLKKKLEAGVVELKEEGKEQQDTAGKTVVLMEMDRRKGLMPTRKREYEASDSTPHDHDSEKDPVYGRQMDLSEMIREEKSITAEDQITMFECNETDAKTNNDDCAIDDSQFKRPKRRRQEEKEARLKGEQRIKDHKFVERTLDSCPKCIESRSLGKHAIVAVGIKTYLAVVDWDGISPDHCYIAPMGHYSNSVVLDEDVWEEMRLWMKGLVAMWRDDDDQDCVFVETNLFVREQKHMSIECIPLPREMGDMAPIYFKKAILESEKEWSDNKKLIDLSKNAKQLTGVRGAIPKGFPYFSVNFGLQPGYVHVIEDERKFPANFAQEIVGGMLDLPHQHWKNPKRQSFDEVKQKREKLRKKWAKYDWTEIVKSEIRGGDRKEMEEEEKERVGLDEAVGKEEE